MAVTSALVSTVANPGVAAGTWTDRLLLTALVLGAIVAALALMRFGWVRRGRGQADVAPVPAVPDLPPEASPADVTDIDARYLGASRSGDWLDRVVVHGLGTPSSAQVSVRADGGVVGVWVVRRGAPDLFVPAAEIGGARHDRAAGGRAVESAALVVIEWARPRAALELALRVRDADQAERLRSAVAALAVTSSTGGSR